MAVYICRYCNRNFERSRKRAGYCCCACANRARAVVRPLHERFWDHVAVGEPEECWWWSGAHTKKGYGHINIGNGVWSAAHRVSWELHKGPIPDGLWVLHRCDNPPCVNPFHLFLGTVLDNNRDMYTKGRHAKDHTWSRGERSGQAKLTEDQVREIRRLHTEGTSTRRLGQRYGVTKTAIYLILKGRNWAHVSSDE